MFKLNLKTFFLVFSFYLPSFGGWYSRGNVGEIWGKKSNSLPNRLKITKCWVPHQGQPVSYRVFSLTWPASTQMYWNKRKRLRKKRVQLPQDWFGTPRWPRFHCFGTPKCRCDVMWKHSVRNLTSVSYFWALNGLNELPATSFEFPFILIGKSTMAFLTGQSYHVLKWGPRKKISALFRRRT